MPRPPTRHFPPPERDFLACNDAIEPRAALHSVDVDLGSVPSEYPSRAVGTDLMSVATLEAPMLWPRGMVQGRSHWHRGEFLLNSRHALLCRVVMPICLA